MDHMADLKKLIREVPDFPKPGVLFYDITTLLKEPRGLHALIDGLASHYENKRPDLVVGIEARGFVFGPALAFRLGVGFAPVRKPKKLPAETVSVTYQLEYGTDTLEIHKDAIYPGQRVLISDDLLATGGTALATVKLVEMLGGIVTGLAFVIELEFLKGRQRLDGHEVFSLIKYER